MKTYLTKEITTIPVVPASERKGIIGGSQVGCLVDIPGCYGTEFDVYRAYMGIQEDATPSMLEAFHAGNMLEGPIAQWFANDIKQPVKELDVQYIDPEEPRLVLHPDREFVNPINGKRYALECKTASSYAMRGDKWPDPVVMDRDRVPGFVPDTLDNGLPLTIYDGASVLPGYYCQCLWYMALAGYDGVFLARLTDNRLYIYFVEPDLENEKILYDAARNWLKKVDAGYRPSPTTLAQARMLFPREEKGKVHVCDDAFLENIAKYEGLNLQKKSIEQQMDEVKANIAEAMGDAEIAKNADGDKICTFKVGSQTRFDTTTFKIVEPELYKQYSKTTEVARTLRIS
jgi:predicted phage-related endonuclease